jgi:hypothetical protein
VGRFFVRRTLKSCALAIPRIKALVDQRNALLAERDQLIASGRGERDQLIESGRRVDELLISNAQLQHALSHMKGLPVPPRHLQERVSAAIFRHFSPPRRARSASSTTFCDPPAKNLPISSACSIWVSVAAG